MNTQTNFDKFLDEEVNLNKNRVDRIKEAQRILSEFVKNHEDFKSLYIDTIPQGSFRQKTIIKPIGDDGEFDVDLLIELNPNPNWSPSDYNKKLSKAFADTKRYEDLTDTDGKTRCVTIDYEGEFHVDLVPAVKRDNKYYVCNKMTDKFEETDGDGYALWFKQQDARASNYLVPTVRLVKYLRDYMGEFDTKSIILTTILGAQVNFGDHFTDLSEAFSTILSRTNDFLSKFDVAPTIQNPAMPGENFDRHWKNDGEGFTKLKNAISAYSKQAAEAHLSKDTGAALRQWKKIFGDSFSNVEIKESVASAYVVGGSFPPVRPWRDSHDNSK